ncbi:unnamed protein product [Paramecium sonneborni]|uniref:Uncharacterized protein n=1 Tax=Paramecium sonneborni TaxID=65129 RepID=A0A8S1R0N8_9CILI|nr:unnamed protein product [Paramecium sonneborni]
MQHIQITECRFIDEIDEVKRFNVAANFCIRRKNEIDNVNINLNQNIKNYVDGEDPYYREIQLKSEELYSQALDGLKLLEQYKMSTHLDQELAASQKEYKQMEQQIKQEEDKKKWNVLEKQKQKAKLVKLMEEIQLSILNKLDLPESDNKSGIIFNWIAGCLIKAKKGPIQLAEELKLKVEKVQLQPESILNQPTPPQSGGIFSCSGRKPLLNSRSLKRDALPEEEQRYYENILAWKAIKQYVFSQEFKFQERVLNFVQEFEKLESFQIMLIEEIVSEKKQLKTYLMLILKIRSELLLKLIKLYCFYQRKINKINSYKLKLKNLIQQNKI